MEYTTTVKYEIFINSHHYTLDGQGFIFVSKYSLEVLMSTLLSRLGDTFILIDTLFSQ